MIPKALRRTASGPAEFRFRKGRGARSVGAQRARGVSYFGASDGVPAVELAASRYSTMCLVTVRTGGAPIKSSDTPVSRMMLARQHTLCSNYLSLVATA